MLGYCLGGGIVAYVEGDLVFAVGIEFLDFWVADRVG